MVSVIPGIIAVAEVCYCYLSYHIYRLMGWEIFKRIGADRMVKRMYAVYQSRRLRFRLNGQLAYAPYSLHLHAQIRCVRAQLCPFRALPNNLWPSDFFFFFAFAIQFVLLVLEQSDSEVRTLEVIHSGMSADVVPMQRYLTVAACPISLILLYVAYYSVRQENRKLMYAVLATCLLAAAYFLFKLFRIYQGKTAAYQLVYKSLTVFCESGSKLVHSSVFAKMRTHYSCSVTGSLAIDLCGSALVPTQLWLRAEATP